MLIFSYKLKKADLIKQYFLKFFCKQTAFLDKNCHRYFLQELRECDLASLGARDVGLVKNWRSRDYDYYELSALGGVGLVLSIHSCQLDLKW